MLMIKEVFFKIKIIVFWEKNSVIYYKFWVELADLIGSLGSCCSATIFQNRSPFCPLKLNYLLRVWIFLSWVTGRAIFTELRRRTEAPAALIGFMFQVRIREGVLLETFIESCEKTLRLYVTCRHLEVWVLL